MVIGITGSTGLIGAAVTARVLERKVRVIRFVRGDPAPNQIGWNPATGLAPGRVPISCDAVIHLAARSIGGGRITDAIKREIVASRVEGTHNLCAALAALNQPPKAIVCASGIGYYGDSADRILDEAAPQGAGFLADLAGQWEAACEPARRAGIRVVNLRLGPVLSRRAGLLKQMLPAVRLGLGGPIGHGNQYLPWVSLSDAADAFVFACDCEPLSGPCNVCSPNPVTMNEFARTLANILHRPAVFRVPPAILKLLFGEAVREMAMDSVRAIPRRLMLAGCQFRDVDLASALTRALEQT
jgi:uncharacterized protein